MFRSAVSFSGDLEVLAQQRLDYPCLTIHQDMLLKEGALLHIQDCTNRMIRGAGGGLYVKEALDLRGELQLHNCHAPHEDAGGGGLYVSGSWADLDLRKSKVR